MSLADNSTVSILYSTIKTRMGIVALGGQSVFQFYIVRLKLKRQARLQQPKGVSILYSTIKTDAIDFCLDTAFLFQFYIVRLKPVIFSPHSLTLMFQFYIVRLKPCLLRLHQKPELSFNSI